VVSTPPVPPADSGVPAHDPEAPRRGDVEHDPTGIRALLSALPDPGPMPADLVSRISASIAAEQSARDGGNVLPLRRRSWGWQHLGAAAAAAVVLAVGIPALLTGTSPGDVLASMGGGSSSDSAGGAAVSVESNDAGADAGGPAAGPSATVAPRSQPSSSGDHRVAGSVGQVALAATGTAYTSAGLATQAATLVTTFKASSAAKDTNGVDGEAGLRACLSALGVPSFLPVRGDVATLDGAPAVIAVVDQGSAQTVYAVAPDCDAPHPTVLAGPLTLP
jgi:hypothetical protein